MATPPRPRAPARRPGRPSGDGDRRAAALDAALACYVRRGIAASSLREIAREAGVTPALLHYYFHDTAGLRDAVIAERLMPVFAEVRDTLLGMPDAPLRTVLTAFVDAICGLIARHAWLPPLWIREVVSEGGSLRGLLNPGLDPRLLMVSLVGLTLFPAAGMPVWRQLFDSDALGIDDIRSHALALIERGLELPQ